MNEQKHLHEEMHHEVGVFHEIDETQSFDEFSDATSTASKSLMSAKGAKK